MDNLIFLLNEQVEIRKEQEQEIQVLNNVIDNLTTEIDRLNKLLKDSYY